MIVEENEVKSNCQNCKHFEVRTKFCRLNPPQPIMFISSEDSILYKEGPSYCSSKYPTIVKPDLDYCSHWEANLISKKDKLIVE